MSHPEEGWISGVKMVNKYISYWNMTCILNESLINYNSFIIMTFLCAPKQRESTENLVTNLYLRNLIYFAGGGS
jgi:hypothetical protein